MQVTDVKWWQWFLLSVFCGAGLAYAHLNPFDGTNVTTLGQERFERFVDPGENAGNHGGLQTIDGKQYPPFLDIVVYPPIANPNGSKLTQMSLYVLDGAKGEYDLRVCNAEAPYYPHLPTSQVAAKAGETMEAVGDRYYGVTSLPRPEKNSVSPVLQAMGDRNSIARNNLNTKFRAGQMINMPPKWTPTVYEYIQTEMTKPGMEWMKTIKIQYAWWAEPRWIWGLWLGGTVAILGVIWPMTLQLLVAGGFGPPPREKLMDMSRYGKGAAEKPAMAVAAMTMTAEEQERLDALEAKIIADLKEQAANTPRSAPPPPVEIKKLDAQPVAAAPVDEHAMKTSKDYQGGIFYPVAAPPKKPGEQTGDADPHAGGKK